MFATHLTGRSISEVLKEFVTTIPDDFNVALRVYGHRHPSKSAETCTDTELIVPLAKLDRAKIIGTASGLKPRGETPLVLSTLETIGDLKAAKGAPSFSSPTARRAARAT
jgi:Ca-activated chloride channel homolog